MNWKDVLELSPTQLQLVIIAVEQKETYAKLANFDGNAALLDEKFLNKLNAEIDAL